MTANESLNQYIQLVERMYRTSQGIALSRLLSLEDKHVLNKSLISGNTTAYVGANSVAPLDDIIITHLLCVKETYKKNYPKGDQHKAFTLNQRQVVDGLFTLINVLMKRIQYFRS